MRHVVFGTAGHIDHGKTSLVKGLTGTDCDRLPEEKARGITIDLGFARFSGDDVVLHFVDVPGHEKLVHTMIAGASGIDLALLVVAADEGVMPQTREHLDVVRLMGVPGGAVALTKTDLVDDETVEFAVEEIRDILQGTVFEGVPIVPVSAVTGRGVDELRKVLMGEAARARPHQVEGRPYREAVDRVFTLPGAGTVITGTSIWGQLEVGSIVQVLPAGHEARVRRLHVHGEERTAVEAGERVALNLAGMSLKECDRGAQVLSLGPWRPSKLITVRLELLSSAQSALDEGDELEVHALAARSPARIDRLATRPVAPGETTSAQISLREAMVLFPGDRLVLRRPSPVNTFGGAEVLDAHLRRYRRVNAAELDACPEAHRGTWAKVVERWVRTAGLVAPSLDDLSGRLGVLPDVMETIVGQLLTESKVSALTCNPPRFVASGVLADLTRKAERELGSRLAGQDVSSGVPARDFIAGLLPTNAREHAAQFLEELENKKVLQVVNGRVLPPGASSHMTAAGKELSRRVEEQFRQAGLAPPAPLEAGAELGANEHALEAVCNFLVQQKALVRLDGKWLIHREALNGVARGVRDWQVAEFAVGDFKDRFGLTRKLAIPILEWLDSQRVTVRAGNKRRVLGR
jgi:selenocysteine-specific elongation factor